MCVYRVQKSIYIHIYIYVYICWYIDILICICVYIFIQYTIYAHIIRRLRVCTHIICHGLGFLLCTERTQNPTSETSVVACSESQVLTHQGRMPQVEFLAAKFQSNGCFPSRSDVFPKGAALAEATLPLRPRPRECQLDLGLHETRSLSCGEFLGGSFAWSSSATQLEVSILFAQLGSIWS